MEQINDKVIILACICLFGLVFLLFLIFTAVKSRGNSNNDSKMESIGIDTTSKRIKIIEEFDENITTVSIVSVDGVEFIVNRKGGIYPLVKV